MKQYVFGVDLGGTTVKLGLFETTGELLDMWEIPTDKRDGGAHIVEDIARALREKLTARGLSPADVEGIGMGVPGPVGADGVVHGCVNLGWGEYPAAARMEELTGLRTRVANDANIAALGELWQGGGKGFSSIVMVTLGTGVGGGIVIDGRILPGSHGAAGEIGHLAMRDDETEICGCGKRGCLEQYASATGVVRLAGRYLAAHPEDPTPLGSLSAVTAKDVFDLARDGDPAALQIVDTFARILGKGLANIACVVDPEAFVIGGGVSAAGEILMDAVRRYYAGYAFPRCKGVGFYAATLGNRAGIYGGAKLLIG